MKRFLITLIILIPWMNAKGCTRVFCNMDSAHMVFARTLDLFADEKPKIIVYPRGIQRKGHVGDYPKKWKSKYGSIVTTAFGKDFVTDGMNEAGLGAHLIFVNETQYESPRPFKQSISNLQWAQYVIDQYKTVNEALEDLQKVQIISARLSNREWAVHLAMEDITGDSAVVEFINGRCIVHQGPQYKAVTTGEVYSRLLTDLKQFKPFGGQAQIPGDADPLSRFVRVSTYLQSLPRTPDGMEVIVGMLSLIRTAQVPVGVNDPWETRWVTVGDLTEKVYYFNSTMHPNLIWANLDQFDLKEGSPIKELDPNRNDLVSNVSKKFTNARFITQ